MGTEIEMKLVCPPAVLARVGRHPAVRALKTGRARTERLVSRYFDTPDGALRGAGLALRVRGTARGWVQTLKGEGAGAGGMQTRPEWNWPVIADAIDPALLLETPAAKALGGRKKFSALLATLVPVFESDFMRTTHPLRFPDGTRAELCVDLGEVRAGNRSEPVCEAEIELLPQEAGADVADLPSSHVASLFDLPLALVETLPLRLGYISKAERAGALAQALRRQPVRAVPVVLSRGMTQAEAFRAIGTPCMLHMQANEAGFMAGRDPEYLHQMRVALRRLRSAFAVFRQRIPADKLAPVADEARMLARQLGAARDWDVFATGTMRVIARAFGGDAAIAALARRTARARSAHGRAARAAISDTAYTRGLLRLARLLASVEDYIDHTAEPLPVFAAQVLQKRHRRVRRLGERLAALTPDELHDFRICAKKLRYAAEFFGTLFPEHRAHRYARALSALQNVLGGLNDLASAERLLGELAPPPDAMTAGILRGWMAASRERQMAELPKAWANFRRQSRFWKHALPPPPPPALVEPPGNVMPEAT